MVIGFCSNYHLNEIIITYIINYFYILDYRLLYISAGIGMLFSGITDMVSNLYLAYAKTKYEKNKAVEEKKDDIVEDSNEE